MWEQDSNIIEVTEESFEQDVLEQSWQMPIVVDFWAPWCGPCRTLTPMLVRLANEPAAGFILAKVNVDENPNLAIRYAVHSIPAVKAFVQGEVVAEFHGVKPEPILRQFLSRIMPDEVDFVLNEALSLMATRHYEDAEDAFRDVIDLYPNNRKALLGLARALLAQGEGGETLALLDSIHDGPELDQADRLRPLAEFLNQFSSPLSLQPDDQLDGDELDVQTRRAAHLLARGNLEAGMDGLLDVLRQDKRYLNGLPRRVLLSIFELLGQDDELTQQYRRELAIVIF